MAKRVEVLLFSARPTDRERPLGQEPFPIRRLKWADVGPELVSLPAGVFRYVDVGFVRPEVGQVFVLRFSPPVIDEKAPLDQTANDSRYWIAEPGVYELVFVVSADSVDASFFTAQIELHLEQTTGRLNVSVVKKPKRLTDLPEWKAQPDKPRSTA